MSSRARIGAMLATIIATLFFTFSHVHAQAGDALMQRAIVELAEQVQQLPETSFVQMASAGALRDQLLKATYRTDALRTVLAALRPAMEAYWHAVTALAGRLLGIAALSLGLPRD